MNAFTDREAQMFPRLSVAQIARLAQVGRRRWVESGEIVFDQGGNTPDFFVVISGALALVQPAGRDEIAIAVLREGQFTGEVNMISGRPSVVRVRVAEAGELLVITPEALLRIVASDIDLSELLLRAFISRRVALIATERGDAVVIGSTHSAATLRIRDFLIRNGQPHSWIDVDRDLGVQALLDRFGLSVADVPVVICRNQRVLKNPTNEQIAECLDFNPAVDPGAIHDVVVVGAGPAGLAAAVYGASEGLDVLVLEGNAPGGQAGASSRIENYLGFPMGISGHELAGRAHLQARKFGAHIAIARSAARLHGLRPREVELADGSALKTRTVVIATGVRYRKLECDDRERFDGVGVYYGATPMEAQLCEGEEVIIVGGGNSAGQAAVFLASTVRHVHIVVRGRGLAETMSRYLISRIEKTPNISLRPHQRVVALDGDGHLERVQIRDTLGGETQTLPIRHVFTMTGADPHTAWLEGSVALDEKGFVKTGTELREADLAGWPLARAPHLLETSAPGVFAVGDVRAGSVKRVAAAVGEGSACIQLVHRVLAE